MVHNSVPGSRWLEELRGQSWTPLMPTEQLRDILRAWQSVPTDERDLFVTALALELIAARMASRTRAEREA